MVVLENVCSYQQNGTQSKQSQKPSVSRVQCLSGNEQDFELEYSTISKDRCGIGIDPEQRIMMNEFMDTDKQTDQVEKLLMFPPHGETPVK